MHQRLVQQVSSVLWPAFMVAAAAELLFFGLVDPLDLQILDGVAGGDRSSLYSVGFLFFWAVGIVAALLAELLHKPASELNRTVPARVRNTGRGVARRQHAMHH
jgi:hypothetical protein